MSRTNRTSRNLFWIILNCYVAFVTCFSHATVRVFRPGVSSASWPYRKDAARLGGRSLTHPTTNIITTTTSTELSNSVEDLAVVGVFGLMTGPVVETLYNVTVKFNSPGNTDPLEFRSTFLYGIVSSVTAAARTWGAVLAVGVVAQWGKIELPFVQEDLIEVAPEIGMVVWLAMAASKIKRRVFRNAISGNRMGRVALYDRLIDFLLLTAASANILNILSVEFTMGLQSLFAASGVSAVVFSLASKGLVEQIVAGFIVQSWDAIEEGEEIRLGDGTEGTVKKIGLVETEIVGPDNIAIRIPNSQLTVQRVSNLSRLTLSQIKQPLRFKYEDLDKIPLVLQSIQDEISISCPHLIADGSKPFQAVITGYEPDHVQALVNCHFRIPPASTEYVQNRQNLLLAIARAVRAHEVQFAIPSIYYQTSGESIPSR